MNSAPKKRNRKILVCTNCRLKKNKCDRTSPCSSCVRLGIQLSCRYATAEDEPRFAFPSPVSTSPTGKAPSRYSPEPAPKSLDKPIRGLNFPYPHLPMGDRDPGSKILWNCWNFQRDDSEFLQFAVSTATLGLDDDMLARCEHAIGDKFTVDYLSYDELLADSVDIFNLKIRATNVGATAGYLYGLCFDSETEPLLVKIRYCLPPVKVMLYLSKVFFENIAPFVPVLDEFDYYACINRIFNLKLGDTVSKISISRREDYAIIAQALLVFRLAWLHELLSDPQFTRLEHHCGFRYKVSLDAITLVHDCINVHGIYAQPSIPLLQTLILVLEYQTRAPESGEAILKDQILRSLILQNAYILGFSTDPRHLDFEEIDSNSSYLRRKIWFHIFTSIVFDACNHSFSGQKLPSISFDTLCPYFELGVTNSKNPYMERVISENYSILDDIYSTYYKALSSIHKDGLEFDFHLVLVQLLRIDHLIGKKFGTFKSIQAMEPGIEKLLALKSFIETRICLSHFLYNIFIRLEQIGGAPQESLTLKEGCFMAFGLLGEISGDILTDCDHVWGSSFRLMIVPLLVLLFNFQTSFAITMNVRLKCTTEMNQNEPQYCSALEELRTGFKKFACSRLRLLHQISTVNCFSWKMVKLNIANYNVTFRDSVYSLQPEAVQAAALKITEKDALSFLQILYENVDTFKDDYYDNTLEQISSKSLLQTNYDIANNQINNDLINYIEADQLWIARTIINLYEVTNVPRGPDDDGHAKDFCFRKSNYTSFPRFRGKYGITME